MKETNRELAESLAFQLSMVKLVSGTEQGMPERTTADRDARTIEQFVRAVSPEAA